MDTMGLFKRDGAPFKQKVLLEPGQPVKVISGYMNKFVIDQVVRFDKFDPCDNTYGFLNDEGLRQWLLADQFVLILK